MHVERSEKGMYERGEEKESEHCCPSGAASPFLHTHPLHTVLEESSNRGTVLQCC